MMLWTKKLTSSFFDTRSELRASEPPTNSEKSEDFVIRCQEGFCGVWAAWKKHRAIEWNGISEVGSNCRQVKQPQAVTKCIH